MKVYNKLVRDKIPQIIQQSGRTTEIKKLEEHEFYNALVKKLHEEVEEFSTSNNLEEIADILEVIKAILKEKNTSWEQMKKIQMKKYQNRGGFEDRIFLIKVNE